MGVGVGVPPPPRSGRRENCYSICLFFTPLCREHAIPTVKSGDKKRSSMPREEELGVEAWDGVANPIHVRMRRGQGRRKGGGRCRSFLIFA